MRINHSDIDGGILAGGRGSRLGGVDKGLVEIAGRPLIAIVIERLSEALDSISINANRNLESYAKFGKPLVPDLRQDFRGPLAGMAALAAASAAKYSLIVPCDSPFFPNELVARLSSMANDADVDIAVALAGGRPQPVFILFANHYAATMADYLDRGERKITTWYRQFDHVEVDFGTDTAPFANINTEQDVLQAAARLRA